MLPNQQRATRVTPCIPTRVCPIAHPLRSVSLTDRTLLYVAVLLIALSAYASLCQGQDTAGWWDQMGWRSAEGAGITHDNNSDPGDVQLVLSSDGDPVALWIDEAGVPTRIGDPGVGGSRIMYHWEVDGTIEAAQYVGGSQGWVDLSSSGQGIGSGTELAIAAGPDGEIVAAWVSGSEIVAARWDGTMWTNFNVSQSDVGIVHEKPDIAISDSGEVFISYATVHPNPNNDVREILVQKFELADLTAAAVELVSEEVGIFGHDQGTSDAQLTGGVSNDVARSYDASIAVNAAGRPIVVWSTQAAEGNIEILCKIWNGQQWSSYGIEGAEDIELGGPKDGLYGVSADEGISIQPDIAVAPNGDVIVTWINWANWEHYEADGRAGVYVKKLPLGVASGAWTEYEPTVSATDAGIAPAFGWHYNPRIDVDSSSKPFITWHSWNFAPTQAGIQYPHEIYASYYSANTFGLLHDPAQTNIANPRLAHTTPALQGVLGTFDAFMPYPLVDTDDNLIIAYTWYDIITNGISRGGHQDSEIFLQQWNGTTWAQYGRGSDSGGNDTFGWANSMWDGQLGLLEEDPCNTTTNEFDVMLANGSNVYRYDRDLDTWSTIDPPGGFSVIYDLRGEPEIEYEVAGSPLLAYVDTATGLPYVFQWNHQAQPDPCWALVGAGAAGPAGNIAGDTGISVQAGPNGKILVAYVDTDADATDRINTRLWDPDVGAWANYGGGVVEIDEVLEVVYYADFDGWDWDNWGEVTDGTYDEGQYPGPTTRIYEGLDKWLFWPGQIDTVNGVDVQLDSQYSYFDSDVSIVPDVSGSVATTYPSLSGGVLPAGVNSGQAFIITIELDEPTDTALGLAVGAQVEGELDYQVELVKPGDVIIEADIMLDARDSANMDLELFLTIDGEVQDAAEGGHAALATVAAGAFAGYSHVTVDTSTYGEGMLTTGDTIGFFLRGTTVASGSTTTYAFPADLQSWTGDWDPSDQGSIAWNANAAGAGKSGILMTLGDGSIDVEITNTATAPATVNGSGDIVVTFDYEMLTKAGLGNLDSLKLDVVLGPQTREDVISIQGISQSETGAASVTFSNMPSGNHVLQFVATLSNAANVANGFATIGLDNIAITLPDDSVPGDQIMFAGIDNVGIYQKITGSGDGTSEWEFSGRAAPGNETAGNPLGRVDAGGGYTSTAVIHNHVFGAGIKTQTYVIPNNIVTTDQGRAVISFRYSYWGSDPGDEFRVILTETTGPTTYTSGLIESGAIVTGWTWARLHVSDLPPPSPSNWDILDPSLPPDLPSGTYQVSFELTSNSVADTDLYLDNIAVLTSNATNTIQPLAILLPTGQGAGGNERNFAVGFSIESPGVNLYADLTLDSVEETRPYDDGPIVVYETLNEFGTDSMAGSQGSYFIGHIMEYDLTDGWERYGDPLGKENGIDFLGFSNGEYLTQGPTDTWLHANTGLITHPLYLIMSAAELAAYRFDMPGDELYRLDDAAAGPFAVLWTLLHRTTGEWVDGDADGLNDHFDFHPVFHPAPEIHWLLGNPGTVLDYQVWRWNPFENASWNDMDFTDDTPVTHGQLVSTGGQDVDVAWTERGNDYVFRHGYVNSYSQSDDAWGVLGTRSVQNDQYGGAMILRDMIIRGNGYPMVAGTMVHIWTDAIREFRPADEIPVVQISESSGSSGDLLLEFIGGPELLIDRLFTITNTGVDDLVIYDLTFGTGVVTNPFTSRNWPDLPLVLEVSESRSFTVRFDPTGLDYGRYTSVVLLHLNATDNPANNIVRFDSLNLFAWIQRGAEIDVIPTALAFDSIAATGKTISLLTTDELDALPTRDFEIHNLGNDDGDTTDDLIVEKWFFTGNDFFVRDIIGVLPWTPLGPDDEVPASIYAFLTRLDPVSGLDEYHAVGILAGIPEDPILIEEGQYLTVRVVFAPETIGVYNEKLYIRSNDSTDPSVAVSLSGQGISGAGLTVTDVTDILNPVPLPDDQGALDFGSVLVGGQGGPTRVELKNTGTSDLTIYSIVVTGTQNDAVTIDPVLLDEVIAPSGTRTITITYDPAEAGELDATLGISNSSPVIEEAYFTISLAGLAVAEVEAILTISSRPDGQDLVNPDQQLNLQLNLGNVIVGSTFDKTIRLSNAGGLAAQINRVEFVRQGWGPFTVTVDPCQNQNLPITIDELDGSDDFTITFSPTEDGYVQDTLFVYFEYTAQGVTTNADISLMVFGWGLEDVTTFPELLVYDNDVDPSDHQIVFAPAFESDTGQGIATIRLSNIGTKEFKSLDVGLTGSGSAAFAIGNSGIYPITLDPGDFHDVSVIFFHATVGVHNASLVITPGPGEGAPVTVSLAGEVLAFQSPDPDEVVVVSPAQPGSPPELGFRLTDPCTQQLRPVYAGIEQSLKKFLIRNPSNKTGLLIRGLEINKPNYFQLVTPISPDKDGDDVPLGPAEDYEVLVTFGPSGYINTTATLTVYSSIIALDGSLTPNPSFTVTLVGVAVAAEEIGKRQDLSRKTAWTDSSGNRVTVKLSGVGTATIVGEEDPKRRTNIDKIILADTNYKSVLRVSGRRDRIVSIGGISGGDMGQIVLKNVSIGAGGIHLDGLAKKLLVGDITGGGDITIDNVLGKAISIRTGWLGADSSIEVKAGDIKKVYISQIVGPNSVVSFAGNVRSLRIGQIGPDSTINIDGQNDVRSFRCGRIENGSVINIAGNVRKIRTGAFGDDSQMKVSGDIGRFRADNFSHGLISAQKIGKITVTGVSFGGTVKVVGKIGKIMAKKAFFSGVITAAEIGKYKFANIQGEGTPP